MRGTMPNQFDRIRADNAGADFIRFIYMPQHPAGCQWRWHQHVRSSARLKTAEKAVCSCRSIMFVSRRELDLKNFSRAQRSGSPIVTAAAPFTSTTPPPTAHRPPPNHRPRQRWAFGQQMLTPQLDKHHRFHECSAHVSVMPDTAARLQSYFICPGT
jgi:hypothetical protein